MLNNERLSYLSFALCFFRFLMFYVFICKIVIILCLWVISFNHNNSLSERKSLRYSRWQRVVMAKCQGQGKKGVFELLYFTVTTYHGGWHVLSLCTKRPSCDPLCRSQDQEESSECHGKIIYNIWILLPTCPLFLS